MPAKRSTINKNKINKSERQCRLVIYILEEGPVTRKEIFSNIYDFAISQGKKTETARREFNRDMQELKECGFHIKCVNNEYTIDKTESFALPLSLDSKDACLLRAVSCSLLEDETYPAADELIRARAKLADLIDGPDTLPIFDKQGFHQKGSQSGTFNKLCKAINENKTLSFKYCDSFGKKSEREVEPIGLYTFEKDVYLAAFDVDKQEKRCFRLDRMKKIKMSKDPLKDARRPFDIKEWLRLPFQFGPEQFNAKIQFGPHVAWRSEYLCKGFGITKEQDDGSVIWEVSANNFEKLASWCIEHDHGIVPIEPKEARDVYYDGLRKAKEVCS